MIRSSGFADLLLVLPLFLALIPANTFGCEFVGTNLTCQVLLPTPTICGRPPSSIKLQFLGTACVDDSLAGSLTSCQTLGGDQISLESNYFTRVSDLRGDVRFTGIVTFRDIFEVVGADGGRLPTDLIIETFSANGSQLLQRVQFHSSCSSPLVVTDVFGAYGVVGIDGSLSATTQLSLVVVIPQDNLALSSIEGTVGSALKPFSVVVDSTLQFSQGTAVPFSLGVAVDFEHPIAGYPVNLTIAEVPSVEDEAPCISTISLICPGSILVEDTSSPSPTASPSTASPTASPSTASPTTPAPTPLSPLDAWKAERSKSDTSKTTTFALFLSRYFTLDGGSRRLGRRLTLRGKE